MARGGLAVKCRCANPDCGQEFWASGWEEPDVNAMGVRDDDPMEDACAHVQSGGSYTIVDSEYDDDPDWDLEDDR